MRQVVEPGWCVFYLALAIVFDYSDVVCSGESFDELLGDAGYQAFVGLNYQVHASQCGGVFGIEQVFLRAFDVAQHQDFLVGIGSKVFRIEQGPNADAIGNGILLGKCRTDFLGLGIQIKCHHFGFRHPSGHPHSVIAFGTADIEEGRVVGLDRCLNVWLQGLLIAAEEFCDVAAFCGLRQKVQALEWAAHDDRALLLQECVLDQDAAPFGEQA